MQSNSLIRFTRSCPTCGRRIQIRGSLLGREVSCQHCNAKFVAMATDDSAGRIDDAQRLLDRVDTILSTKIETPPVVS
ncbi:hypothetical protein CGZ80_19955 [Rhodopirellula sp. MGV]|nr:hypothetical protein CGZ80_19955 [Rhodopirellula sp. MGV]PNY35875.1 hypothetical protein C2E31_15530 [Rhodopirellula baltica]